MWRRILKNYELYVFLLPAIVYFFIFCYMPMYGVQIAFRNFMPNKGILGSPWVGLKHFQRIFRLPSFGAIVWNTLAISLYSLLVSFPVPILLALVINEIRSSGYRRVVQTVSYAPHFISTVVLVSLIEMFCNTDYGVINRVVELFGGEAVQFLSNQRYFRSLYVLSGVWQSSGWSAIVYLSALSSIDPGTFQGGLLMAQILDRLMAHGTDNGEHPVCAAHPPLRVVVRQSSRRLVCDLSKVSDALEMIRLRACEGIGVDDVALEMGVSRRTAERHFRLATRKSILDEILDRRFEMVFEMLRDRKRQIGAIAGLCGFTTEVALRKSFRLRTGMSMSEWRDRFA